MLRKMVSSGFVRNHLNGPLLFLISLPTIMSVAYLTIWIVSVIHGDSMMNYHDGLFPYVACVPGVLWVFIMGLQSLTLLVDWIIKLVSGYVTRGNNTIRNFIMSKVYDAIGYYALEDDNRARYRREKERTDYINAYFTAFFSIVVGVTYAVGLLFISFNFLYIYMALGLGYGMLRLSRFAYDTRCEFNSHTADPNAHKFEDEKKGIADKYGL